MAQVGEEEEPPPPAAAVRRCRWAKPDLEGLVSALNRHNTDVGRHLTVAVDTDTRRLWPHLSPITEELIAEAVSDNMDMLRPLMSWSGLSLEVLAYDNASPSRAPSPVTCATTADMTAGLVTVASQRAGTPVCFVLRSTNGRNADVTIEVGVGDGRKRVGTFRVPAVEGVRVDRLGERDAAIRIVAEGGEVATALGIRRTMGRNRFTFTIHSARATVDMARDMLVSDQGFGALEAHGSSDSAQLLQAKWEAMRGEVRTLVDTVDRKVAAMRAVHLDVQQLMRQDAEEDTVDVRLGRLEDAYNHVSSAARRQLQLLRHLLSSREDDMLRAQYACAGGAAGSAGSAGGSAGYAVFGGSTGSRFTRVPRLRNPVPLGSFVVSFVVGDPPTATAAPAAPPPTANVYAQASASTKSPSSP